MRPSRGAGNASGLLPVPLLEAVDATRGVHQFLLSGEERMAVRTDLQAKFLLGRTGGPDGATGAVNVHLFVIGMNSSFHGTTPRKSLQERGRISKLLQPAKPPGTRHSAPGTSDQAYEVANPANIHSVCTLTNPDQRCRVPGAECRAGVFLRRPSV